MAYFQGHTDTEALLRDKEHDPYALKQTYLHQPLMWKTFSGLASIFLCAILIRGCFKGYGFPLPFVSDHQKNAVETINNRTLGFGNIYVINLPDRVDRRDELKLMALATNINLQVLKGLPKEALTFPYSMPAPSNKTMETSELSRYRNHASAWREMLEANIDTALFIEDTADWGNSIRDALVDLQKPLLRIQDQINPGRIRRDATFRKVYKGDWDIIKLGLCNREHWDSFERNASAPFEPLPYVVYTQHHSQVYGGMRTQDRSLETSLSTDLLCEGHRHRRIQLSHSTECVTGYALSQRGAAKLLYRATRAVKGPLDSLFGEAGADGYIKSYSVTPGIIKRANPQLSPTIVQHRTKNKCLVENGSVRDTLQEGLRASSDISR